MAQQFHYYATCCYGWAVADERERALKNLIQSVGSGILKRAVKSSGGVAAVVCRVELPQAAHYSINEYMPSKIAKEDGVNEARKGEPVPLSEIERVFITTMQGRTIPREVEEY